MTQRNRFSIIKVASLAGIVGVGSMLAVQTQAADSEDVAAGLVLGAILGYSLSDQHYAPATRGLNVHYRSDSYYHVPRHEYRHHHPKTKYYKHGRSHHRWHPSHHGKSAWAHKQRSRHHDSWRSRDRYHR